MSHPDPIAELAVDMSQAGVALYQRLPDGTWTELATAAFDSETHAEDMLGLREAAVRAGGAGFVTRLWLPEDQVLIRSLKLSAETGVAREREVRGALVAMTPYRSDEICFDVAETEIGGRYTVVAASVDTVREAMTFAQFHDLRPEFVSTHAETIGFANAPVLQQPPKPLIPRKTLVRAGGAVMAGVVAVGVYVAAGPLSWVWSNPPDVTMALAELSDAPGALEPPGLVAMVAQVRHVPRSADPTRQPVSQTLPPEAETRSTNSWYLLRDLRPEPIVAPASSDQAEIAPIDRPKRILVAALPPQDDLVLAARPTASTTKTMVSVISAPSGALESWFRTPVSPAVTRIVASALPYTSGDYRETRPALPVNTLPILVERPPQGEELDGIELANVEQAGTPLRRPGTPQVLNDATVSDGTGETVPIAVGPPPKTPPPRPQPEMDPPKPRPNRALVGNDEIASLPRPIPAPRREPVTATEPAPVPDAPAVEPTAPVVAAIQPPAEGTTEESVTLPSTSEDASPDPSTSTNTSPPTEPDSSTVVQPPSVTETAPTPSAVPVAPATEPATENPVSPTAPTPGGVEIASAPSTPSNPATEVPAATGTDSPDADVTTAVPQDTSVLPDSASLVPVPPATAPSADVAPVPDTSTGPGVDIAALPPEPSPSPLEAVRPAIKPDPFAPTTNAPRRADRPQSRPATVPEVALPPDTTPTQNAVLTATAAKSRPANLGARAAEARKARETTRTARKPDPAPATRPSSVKRPSAPLPTTASVRKAATKRDAIDLSAMSLIGVYGSPRSRRALIRMPSGSYLRVTRGDKVDGWNVAAVGEDSLRLAKGGKTQVLRVPAR